MDFYVREYKECDRAAVEALNETCFKEARGIYPFMVVAENEDGEVIGYCAGKPLKEGNSEAIPAGSLYSAVAAVHPNYRRMGAATAMQEEMEALYLRQVVAGEVFYETKDGGSAPVRPLMRGETPIIKICKHIHERNEESRGLAASRGFHHFRLSKSIYGPDNFLGKGRGLVYEKDVIVPSPDIRIRRGSEPDYTAIWNLYDKAFVHCGEMSLHELKASLSDAFYIACAWDMAHSRPILAGVAVLFRHIDRGGAETYEIKGQSLHPDYEDQRVKALLLQLCLKEAEALHELAIPSKSQADEPLPIVAKITPSDTALMRHFKTAGFTVQKRDPLETGVSSGSEDDYVVLTIEPEEPKKLSPI